MHYNEECFNFVSAMAEKHLTSLGTRLSSLKITVEI